MSRSLIVLLLVLAGAGALFVLAGLWFLGWQSGRQAPDHLSDRDLSFDNGKPNYVSSLTTRPDRHIEPFAFEIDEDDAWAAARATVAALPRTRIVVEETGYLRAESRTALFRFVDDVELLRNPGEKFIHIRSGSRVGRSDLGTNAKRVEEIRKGFSSRLNPPAG